MTCPVCGEEMEIGEYVITYKGQKLKEKYWACPGCLNVEEWEPDWDSMKGGKDYK